MLGYEIGHVAVDPLHFENAAIWCENAVLEPVNGIKMAFGLSFEVPEVFSIPYTT
jgi:hypothetical protein